MVNMRILFKKLKQRKFKLITLTKNPRLWYPRSASKKSDKRRKKANLKSLSKQQVNGAWSFQQKEVRTLSACSAS